MATFDLFYKAATKEVFIREDGAATPAGSVVLGTYDHEGNDPDDKLGLDANHCLANHVQDLCYAAGMQNMQEISIVLMCTAVNAGADKQIDLSNAETYQVRPVLTPDASHLAYPACTYASSDPTKATVSATGLVTPVAVGTTNITVTNTQSGKSDVMVITVVA